MIPEAIAISVGLLSVLGEVLHARRSRRTARLAFGPRGEPRRWTASAPLFRVLSLSAVAWGLAQLWILDPQASLPRVNEERGERHLILALDVSPSMKLVDGGEAHQQSRAQRASEVVSSILDRADLNRLRVSVVAFYTGAKPVVVDTFDLAVVKNILDDLPLDLAFDSGKTTLLDGVRESAKLANDWAPGSASLLIVSDGDTVPDTGLPRLPPAIRDVLVLGVGSRGGLNIDGHLSRQDSSTLRQLAARLSGEFFDANEKLLPTKLLQSLAKAVPLRNEAAVGRRELALAAVALGSATLALLPLALALAGSAWRTQRGASLPIGRSISSTVNVT